MCIGRDRVRVSRPTNMYCISCSVHQDPNCQVTLPYCTYKYTAICSTVLLLAPDVEHVWPVSETQSLPCTVSRQSNRSHLLLISDPGVMGHSYWQYSLLGFRSLLTDTQQARAPETWPSHAESLSACCHAYWRFNQKPLK